MLPNQQQHYKIHVTEGLLWHWPWPCHFGVDYSQVRYCKDCKSWQVMTCITNLSKMDWQTFASRPTGQDHKDWSRESRPMPGLVLTLEMQTKELRRRPSPTGRGCCSWELASRLRASTLQVIVSCSKVIFKMWGTDQQTRRKPTPVSVFLNLWHARRNVKYSTLYNVYVYVAVQCCF